MLQIPAQMHTVTAVTATAALHTVRTFTLVFCMSNVQAAISAQRSVGCNSATCTALHELCHIVCMMQYKGMAASICIADNLVVLFSSAARVFKTECSWFRLD